MVSPCKPYRKPFSLATLLAAAALVSLPLCSMAQDHPYGERWHGAEMHEHMQQHMQQHLDKLAARLEIRASQQEAWSGFAAAVHAMAPTAPPQPPARDLDAAARARQAADHAGEMARKLSALADATSKLEQALDPSQRKVLDEVARHFGHHRHGHGEGGWAMHGGMHGEMHGEHCDDPAHEGHGGMHEEHGGMHEHADGAVHESH